MILYIGIDDTDVLGSPGTGHLARSLAGQLAGRYPLLGVTRHQLLEDPRVPCTKKNSSAGIMLQVPENFDPNIIYPEIEAVVIAHSAGGSDPGLWRKVKQELVDQQEARDLAEKHGIILRGLGGDLDGIIGALSAVGLDADGNDGRYVLVGNSRNLQGLQSVSVLLAAGIAAVQTQDGNPVIEGSIQTDQLRPARRGGQPIAVVQWTGSYWNPLKLD